MMKKALINKKYIAKIATRWTVGIFSVLGFIDLFTSFTDVYPEKWGMMIKIVISITMLVFVWVVSAIIAAITFEKKKWIEVFEVNNGFHVYVQYGDVFSADEVESNVGRRNVVIPVNRCFDTIVNDDVVSSNTLQGSTFNKLYCDNIYTQDSLNEAIQNDLLLRQKCEFETITKNEKRSGNLKRFPIGTVAEVKESSSCEYFLLALSTFDRDLTAHTTQQEYVLAMQRLIEYCNNRSQSYPVVVPLIGAGLSRTKNSEKELLEFMIKILKLNKELICCNIHIVVRNSGKDSIQITEL